MPCDEFQVFLDSESRLGPKNICIINRIVNIIKKNITQFIIYQDYDYTQIIYYN